jgi:hypothetical protein
LQQELPAVALLLSQKTAFHQSGLSLLSGAVSGSDFIYNLSFLGLITQSFASIF